MKPANTNIGLVGSLPLSSKNPCRAITLLNLTLPQSGPSSEPRNRAPADFVAAGEFRKRRGRAPAAVLQNPAAQCNGAG